MSDIKPLHKMMLQQLASMIEEYAPKVEVHNSALGEKDKKFAQWLERVPRAEESNVSFINAETFVRSEASLNDLASIHDWLKNMTKVVQDLLTTQHFVHLHESAVNTDESNNSNNVSLLEEYKELTTLFSAVRSLGIPTPILQEFLPIRIGKAPRSGKEIPKLNVDRPKSELKQIRENSNWIKLVVDDETKSEPIGIAITKYLGMTLPEFQDHISPQTMYEMIDSDPIEINGKDVTLSLNE